MNTKKLSGYAKALKKLGYKPTWRARGATRGQTRYLESLIDKHRAYLDSAKGLRGYTRTFEAGDTVATIVAKEAKSESQAVFVKLKGDKKAGVLAAVGSAQRTPNGVIVVVPADVKKYSIGVNSRGDYYVDYAKIRRTSRKLDPVALAENTKAYLDSVMAEIGAVRKGAVTLTVNDVQSRNMKSMTLNDFFTYLAGVFASAPGYEKELSEQFRITYTETLETAKLKREAKRSAKKALKAAGDLKLKEMTLAVKEWGGKVIKLAKLEIE